MAGGTSRKNHSEVGSSYIHFNYTPNQDKATPSLIGDVPRGVMLNQAPIFLGGQGGLVGPLRIEYGTVIAAGVIYREDVSEQGRLFFGHSPVDRSSHFYPGLYWYLKRIVVNNIHYVANLVALKQWYTEIRLQFFTGDAMGQMLYEGLLDKVNMAIEERIKRLKALSQKMPDSIKTYRTIMKQDANKKLLRQKQMMYEKWQPLEDVFVRNADNRGDASVREPFVEELNRRKEEKRSEYIAVIQGLEASWSAQGTKWLKGIVDDIHRQVFEVIPAFTDAQG
jgi:UDP-N-acetylglucosamine/UDP-N-acetylgalactosamine diphosphorylase